MQRGKATCLPRQIVVVLPRSLALDHPRTSCRLHDHTSKNMHKIRNSTNRTEYVGKVKRDARIARP